MILRSNYIKTKNLAPTAAKQTKATTTSILLMVPVLYHCLTLWAFQLLPGSSSQGSDHRERLISTACATDLKPALMDLAESSMAEF